MPSTLHVPRCILIGRQTTFERLRYPYIHMDNLGDVRLTKGAFEDGRIRNDIHMDTTRADALVRSITEFRFQVLDLPPDEAE